MGPLVSRRTFLKSAATVAVASALPVVRSQPATPWPAGSFIGLDRRTQRLALFDTRRDMLAVGVWDGTRLVTYGPAWARSNVSL